MLFRASTSSVVETCRSFAAADSAADSCSRLSGPPLGAACSSMACEQVTQRRLHKMYRSYPRGLHAGLHPERASLGTALHTQTSPESWCVAELSKNHQAHSSRVQLVCSSWLLAFLAVRSADGLPARFCGAAHYSSSCCCCCDLLLLRLSCQQHPSSRASRLLVLRACACLCRRLSVVGAAVSPSFRHTMLLAFSLTCRKAAHVIPPMLSRLL